MNRKVKDFFINGDADMCYITDISVSEAIAKEIDESGKKYVLLDHHPTALGLNKFSWCKVKVWNDASTMKTCGTEMFYEYLLPRNSILSKDIIQRFVDIVRDYDTWRWATLGESGLVSKKTNNLFHLYGREDFLDWCYNKFVNNLSFDYFDNMDTLLLRNEEKQIDAYVNHIDKKLNIVKIVGRKAGVVFADRYQSELGNRLCTMHPELDFVAMIDMNGVISYRTVKENIDLGKDIASVFGGGGHPKAAGSQISDEIKLEAIRTVFNYKI